jgi:hypothetical protein
MSDNIIHSFQQRRQLTQDVLALGQTQSEAELMERVRLLIREHPADLLAATVIKHLDTTNSQLRGGLGHIASLLPPEEISPLLRSVAANRASSPQLRVTAALILERFLGESLSPAILNDLGQTNEVAFQSLREEAEEGERNRHVLYEYVMQMHQTNEQIALMVLDLVGRLEPDQRVDLYRLLAQDEWPVVARAALPKLERLAAENERALQALYTLRFMLPPNEAEQVTRTMRKLQFTGHTYTPPPISGWRALMSPPDVGGSYSIWFVKGPEQSIGDGVLMGMVVNHRLGVLQTFGSETMPAEQLPSAHPVGQLVTVRSDHGQSAILLEIPFEVARWLVAQTHAAHWAALPLRPLPGEYRLYGDRLWRFAMPEIDPALARYFSEDDTPLPPIEEIDAAAVELLAHPALDGWSFNNRLLLHTLNAAGSSLSQLPLQEIAAVMIRELSQRAEYVQLLAALDAALRAQAVWLHIAGNAESASRAYLLARTMELLPPAENPLLLHLLEAGLRPNA